MAANQERLCEGDPTLSLCFRLFGTPAECLSDAELWAAERELGVTLPQSYLTFLRYYGATAGRSLELFGLPRDHRWRDVVLMNRADRSSRPLTLLKIAEDGAGGAYYLDTACPDNTGECPVLGWVSGGDATPTFVAQTFVRFLERVDAGLGLRTIGREALGKEGNRAI